jgi:hypothetical protein
MFTSAWLGQRTNHAHRNPWQVSRLQPLEPARVRVFGRDHVYVEFGKERCEPIMQRLG